MSTERARLCDDAMGLGSLLFATLLGVAGRVGSVLASQSSHIKEGHRHTIAVNQCKVDGRKEEYTSIKDVRPSPCRVYLVKTSVSRNVDKDNCGEFAIWTDIS